jgi:hypothetical protein
MRPDVSAPRPKIVKQVCSLCGLDWKDHGKAPTAETCVKLLLDEVRSLNAQIAVRPRPYSQPFIPYPVPYPRPYWPQWYGNTYTVGLSGNTSSWQSNLATMNGPQAITVKAGTVTSA